MIDLVDRASRFLAERGYEAHVRRLDEFTGREGMEECCDIAELLKGAWLDSENGSYAFEGQEIYTEPQELALEETGFYAWETRIKASITR